MANVDDEGRMALWCIHNPDQAAAEIERLRRALKNIDAVATQKKAGAAVRMQRIARCALSPSNGTREGAT